MTSIGDRFNKPIITQDECDAYNIAAEWCNQNQAMIEDKGDHYEVVAIPEPEPPTPEEIQLRLTQAVQRHLDAKAMELGYDSCLSVCSYVDTGIPKFDAEGVAFRSWRSAVWAKCYEILEEVKLGVKDIPTEEELISDLPKLVIEYPELAQVDVAETV